MVGADIKQQLKNLIQSMRDQGVLDYHFDQVKELQNEERPQFLLDIISMFSRDADHAISEVNRLLGEPVVDYPKVTGFVHQLRGSSSSIGGCRMALACRELRYATDDNNKGRSLEAFEKVKSEYQVLRENLNSIAQLERTIDANEAKAKKQG